MRLSYFRDALKAAPEPAKVFAEAIEKLRLNERFASLLKQFLPVAKRHDVAEPLTA